MVKSKENKSNTLESCTLYVDGMHCPSCEILIEKKLLKQKNIESVNATLKDSKVTIVFKGERPKVQELNTQFAKLGYKFQKDKIRRDSTPFIKFTSSGSIAFNKNKVTGLVKVVLLILSFIFLFFIVEDLQLGQYVSVDVTSSLPAFFALGLVAGVSSCAALVGGLLLSMIKQWNEQYIDSDSQIQKATPHILFHSGRIISFLFLGGVLGFIGERISLDNLDIFAFITIAVSILMFITALQMIGIEWAQRFSFNAPKSATKFVANENNFRGKFMPFASGALTFLLPCGFTLAAQTLALTSGSVTQGAFIMLFFVLGTFIPLLAISLSGLAFNTKPHLTAKFNIIAGLIIIFFVIYNVNGQLNVLGLPSLNDFGKLIENTRQQNLIEIKEGQQELNIIAKGFEYISTGTTRIRAGIPTVLVVDNQGISGCGVFMAAKGLMDSVVQLKKGENIIELGSPKKGTYKLTCSMGMVPPVTIEVI